MIAPDGGVAQLHPISARLSASNGFNGRSVAIEFAGNLRAVNGNWWSPETHGRDTLTEAQTLAGRKLLKMLNWRAGIRYVFAHRQSWHDKGNDPGPEIGSTVGQWALGRLGMSDGGPSTRSGQASQSPASGEPTPSTHEGRRDEEQRMVHALRAGRGASRGLARSPNSFAPSAW